MSSTKETLADIVADLRERAADLGRWKGTMWNHSEIEAELTEYADRIEDAAEREREIARDLGRIDRESDNMARAADALEKGIAPGNAAAMREALEEISARIKQEIEQPIPENDPTGGVAMCEMEGIARAALSAPARNVDRFQTAEEAVAAFADHLRAWENAHGICSEYPDHAVKVPAGAFAWLFAKAEGGAE